MGMFDTATAAALNTRFSNSYENLAFRLNAFLGLANHGDSSKLGGDSIVVRCKTGYSPGAGARYADAYANVGQTSRERFTITPSKLYALETVDHSGALFSQGDMNAVVNTMGDAQDSCAESAAVQLEQAMFSDGFGTLATIKSNTGSGPYVLTLTNPTDAFKFQNAQVLSSKVTPATAGLDAGTATVTAFDGIAGTVTVTAAGGWTPTNTHVLGLQATFDATGALTTFPGLGAWLTNDATTLAASFYGVTRSKNPQGLAGHVFSGVATPIDAINAVINSISNFGPKASPSVVFVNSSTHEDLMRQLDNRAVILSQSKAQDVDVLYDGVTFAGPNGKKLTVHVASACSPNDIWVIDPDTWYVQGPGNKFIHPGQPDGTPFVPLIATDQTLVKFRAEGFVYCDAPGYNGRYIRL